MVEGIIRAFFAVELPANIKTDLNESLNPLKNHLQKQIRWISLDQLHITLKFLGAFKLKHISQIEKELLNSLNGFDPIKLKIENLGIFPGAGNPRIIWIGFSHTDKLCDLGSIIEHCTKKCGYESEKRPFSPHLTIGRVKRKASNEDRLKIRKIISEFRIPEIIPFTINHLSFIKSKLTPHGPIYTSLFNINL